MSETASSTGTVPKTRKLSRTRGAASGVLLILLGAWGALAPFIGPWFNFAFTPDKSWTWTAARGWFEVLPGSVTFLAGVLLLTGTTRAVTLLGAWMGILAGGWFVIGPPLTSELTLGRLGQPTGSSSAVRVLETLTFFYGLGAIILFLAASAFGRLSVVTLRDLRTAERREAARVEAEREAADRQSREREETHRDLFSPQDDAPDARRGIAEPTGAGGYDRPGQGFPDDDAAERQAAERAAAERNAANRQAAERHAGGQDTQQHGTRQQDTRQQDTRQQDTKGTPPAGYRPTPGNGDDPALRPDPSGPGTGSTSGSDASGYSRPTYGRHDAGQGAPPPPPPPSR
ncbi:MAG: hypothetical protein ACRDVG_15000 [Jatrophihabitantaceae bacterium]